VSLLSQMRISKRLPIVIMVLVVAAVLVTSFVTVRRATQDAKMATKEKLVALQASRVAALGNYLGSIEQDLSSLAVSDYVRGALQGFKQAWTAFDGAPKDILQELYIDKNPHPTGSKHELDAADDGSIYSMIHKRYHPWFRHFLTQRDYYDIFLFDTKGNLVYTVFKELDYATNMNDGEWKDTDLAHAYRAANDGADDTQHFFDFKPYAPSHGAAASFISQAVLDHKGNVLGVLVFQMPIARINGVMQVAAGMGESGETYIVGTDYLMRSDSRFSEESTILKTKVTGQTVDGALKGNDGADIVQDYRGISVFSAYGPIDFKGTRWAVLAEIDESEAMAPIKDMEMFVIIATLAILVGSAVLGGTIAKDIARPISTISEAMSDLAKGNMGITVPFTDKTDEVGDVARALEVFKENEIERLRLAEEQEIENKEKLARVERVNEMITNFEMVVEELIAGLSGASREMESTSTFMNKIAEQTSERSTIIAAEAEETGVNVQSVASATEELSVSIQGIRSQATSSVKSAEEASEHVSSTEATIGELSKAADRINEVISLITDIAEQTNLLALNATIEAARAGEAGKGFAVVASEVKNLAAQTARATEEISETIGTVQTETGKAVDAIAHVSSVILEVGKTVHSISDAVEQQTEATQEISRNVQEASTGTNEMTKNITSVSSSAEESQKSAMEVLNIAQQLAQQSNNMKEAVEEFLTGIRAA